MSKSDFVLTIDSEDEEAGFPIIPEEESEEEIVVEKKKNKKKKGKKQEEEVEEKTNEDLNPDFLFTLDDFEITTDFQGWEFKVDEEKQVTKKDVDLDGIIRRKGGLGKLAGTATAEEEQEEEESENDEGDEDDDELAMDGFGMGVEEEQEEDEDEDEEEEEEEEEKAEETEIPIDVGSNLPDVEIEEDTAEDMANFYAAEEDQPETNKQIHKTFNTLSLSRPVLRGLANLGYSTPSPIQSATIPIALLGKDIVAGAVTGSGKTAAYMIPIIERLLYKPAKIASTRVIVLAPTRELAIQVADVGKKIGQYVNGLSFGLAVGGLNLRQQEQELKTRPDIVVATPGRFIDHIRNSPSFSVDSVEVLVVDEADRMLEEGFQKELSEILSLIPSQRQTLLFSATMNSKIKSLVQLSLQRPVRVMINPPKQAASGLMQEFVRIRKREPLKPSLLFNLLKKIDSKQQNRIVVFVARKEMAHKLRIILGLLGMKVSELHGSLTQDQRLKSITDFKNLDVPVLICTDLASRGLDIPKIEVVVNFDMPKTYEIYLHRVGRTARAGREGRSISFVGESSGDRSIVKEAIQGVEDSKNGKAVGRNVDWKEVEEINKIISTKESTIEEVLEEEKQEKEILSAEMELRKGENLLRYKSEIQSRPKRTWFQTEAEKKSDTLRVLSKGGKQINSKKRKTIEERKEVGRSYKKTKIDRSEDQKRTYAKQKAKVDKKKKKLRAKR